MEVVAPTLQNFEACMADLDCVRNVCILAHVDHGKTTVADILLATNRIVSQRMAGFLRYLDDRPDEQERGITMKSSAVSLLNVVKDETKGKDFKILLNLVDTPGHIDFSSEVAAAIRVCDGAVILVDLVEGICSQTREAIVKAYEEHTKMILMLNKFDRLIVELRKDLEEVYQCILRVIEGCNVIIAELYQYDFSENKVDIEETGLLFSPDTGNVIFASSIDGWGFTTKQIAKIFIDFVENETVETLNAHMWNLDCYVNAKGQIRTGATVKKKPNLFKQFCLKTVMHVYETLVIRMDRDKMTAITDKLKIRNITRDMTSSDPKKQVRAIMQEWKPLSATIFLQCLQLLNPPNKLDRAKIDYLLNVDKFCENPYLDKCLNHVIPYFQFRKTDDVVPTIAYVSKMFCVDKRFLSQNKPKVFVPKPREQLLQERAAAAAALQGGNEEKTKKENTEDSDGSGNANACITDVAVIAFARVYIGTLTIGQEIFVLKNSYLPNEKLIAENSDEFVGNNGDIQRITIKELYMLFGRELVLVNSIPAGNFCGIGGIEHVVSRTATLSSIVNMVPLTEHVSLKPVVRHAIEPANPKELPILNNALKLLMQSDSCVEVMMQETGELVLLTAGDVHLGKCIEDLKTKFAKIEFNVSNPMVALRETICPKPDNELSRDSAYTIALDTEHVSLTVLAAPLPEEIGNIVRNHQDLLCLVEAHKYKSFIDIAKLCFDDSGSSELNVSPAKVFKSETLERSLCHVKEQLNLAFSSSECILNGMGNIWSVGKTSDCVNLLINNVPGFPRDIFHEINCYDKRSLFDQCMVKAFNTVCKAGPICGEPLTNCVFVVNNFELVKDITSDVITPQYTSSLESAIRSTLKKAFEKHPQRLMEPLYVTEIQVNTSILGKVYTVLHKRHGKVIEDVCMDDREKIFLVKAQIPVIESEGFANEIRKATSGQANPNLRFSHYEIINGDPYYEPVEEDNEEEDDDDKELDLRASKLRIATRKRKGLQVEEEIVVHAEKQRTLNKKK